MNDSPLAVWCFFALAFEFTNFNTRLFGTSSQKPWRPGSASWARKSARSCASGIAPVQKDALPSA